MKKISNSKSRYDTMPNDCNVKIAWNAQKTISCSYWESLTFVVY